MEADAIEAVQRYARTHKLSFAKAASELIRRGARYQLGIRERNGFPVVDVPDDFPLITSERVRELLDPA